MPYLDQDTVSSNRQFYLSGNCIEWNTSLKGMMQAFNEDCRNWLIWIKRLSVSGKRIWLPPPLMEEVIFLIASMCVSVSVTFFTLPADHEPLDLLSKVKVTWQGQRGFLSSDNQWLHTPWVSRKYCIRWGPRKWHHMNGDLADTGTILQPAIV